MAKQIITPPAARIKCVGIGGGGCNAITRMVREGIKGVEFIAMNTDGQALALSEAPTRIQLGEKMTRGLGAGGDHKVGAKSTEENHSDIEAVLDGADMVFITAGMGGGTGTGGTPIVAEIAKKSGALTIAVVTKPFSFEGAHRARVAEEGLVALNNKTDTLIIVPNDRLLQLCDAKTPVDNAFRLADNALFFGVKAISEVVTVPGLINLDFADIRSVLKDAGPAWMSVGRASGQNRAAEAAKIALASPLLDVSITGAKGVLFNVSGGPSLTLFECNEAAQVIAQAVDPEANIIFGVVFDPKMDSELQITAIATGFVTQYSKEGIPTEELRRLIKGGGETLDVPSFLRHRPASFPSSPLKAGTPTSTQWSTPSPAKVSRQ
ncbi:MAG: cell division protein FtsZ [Syntrophobacterales bacterium CG23_combo_of_CG06-09_8_20_14_all_48_27]|nr:MAG: cell division protein FtsZ [Syntrophobacterales bacterium CG23_combo_of_CG06-09_8_20_14_all_48_27]PIX26988.1 MAG: cell division protein FtsZ [Chloroflexi bacterium CG_4_8_14_3_um_filter_45_15]